MLSETLETQSYIIATASRATEDEAFALSAALAGLGKLALAFILMPRLGLLGLALSNALALVLTNHWYMVRRGLKRLKVSAKSYLAHVVVPCGAFFVCSVAGLWATARLIAGAGDVTKVIVIAAVAGVLLVIAIWSLVLERPERMRLLRLVYSTAG